MNQPAWERLVDLVDIKFGITDHGKEKLPLEDNPRLEQSIDFVCFERQGEKYRLERISRPAVLEQKSIYHRAAGSGVRFENVYDAQELSHHISLLLRKGDEWHKIDLEDLAL